MGGHFLERAAKFFVENVPEASVGGIAIVMNREEQRGGVRLSYVEEIVATLMRSSLGPGDHSDSAIGECVSELFTGMLTGVNHAVSAMHCIALVYLIDRFREE
jgi:hypothetical protein